MCGIAGVYRTDGQFVRETTVRRMTDMLTHRGPDDAGYFVNGSIGLGSRRLAILDLSPAGRQPMTNEDGSLWLVYNGEIYNFRELRRELEARGHCFRSRTDTEVVLHAYEEWGEMCVQRFNGMFAFALWDARRQCLMLARDPLGIKPLFYLWDARKGLWFGSEIKAILADPEVPRVLDEEALDLYLTFYYVPQPRTLFKGIRHLLPGHVMLLHPGEEPRVSAYWDWCPSARQFNESFSEDEYAHHLEILLEQAVRRQLVSDVPFGIFLSGGLDSSTVTHFMIQALKRPVQSFSIGFEEPSYNELPAARRVARHYGTLHHEYIVRAQDVETVLPKLVWHADEPLADASLIPTYFVAKLAREHVKMVLSGDGGDELFAGYETYPAYFLARLYRYVPRPVRATIRALVQRLPASYEKYGLDEKARRFVYATELPPDYIHAAWRVAWREDLKRQLYTPDFAAQVAASQPFEVFAEYLRAAPWPEGLNRLLYADLRLYLPSDLLAKVDRASMACSLEVRVPLLDREVVEFMAQVPPHLKLGPRFQKKYLLKKLMARYLPPDILKRPKQGFVVPIGQWMRGPLRTFTESILLDDALYRLGYLRKQAVQRFWKEHQEGRRDYTYALWSLLVLALWYRAFWKGSNP